LLYLYTMKRVTSILFLVLVSAGTLWAQQQKLNRDPQYIVDPTAIMRILTPPPDVEGTALMYDDWQQAAVFLSNGKQGTVLDVNYDLLNNFVPVFYDQEEYSINGIAIDSLVIKQKNEVLVSGKVLKGFAGDQLLLRVYNGSDYALYRKTIVDVIKPNYNELLNVGSRNFKIDKSYKYVLHAKSDQKYYDFNNKKDLKVLPNYAQLTSFLKQSKVGMKLESDLVSIAEAYQQLDQ